MSVDILREREWISKAVCWDKDSTLVSTLHRQHLVPEVRAGRMTWEQYALACSDDAPFPDVAVMMRVLARTHLQIVMTGADDTAREPVLKMISRHNLPVDRLYMRKAGSDGGIESNARTKVRWIKQLRREAIDPELFFEDWPETAEIIRRDARIAVVVLNPCYPPELEALAAIRGGNV